jgi:hypothetical protein
MKSFAQRTLLGTLLLGFLSFPFASDAQKKKDHKIQYGIGASVGVRQQTVTSTYSQINNITLYQEGGAVMFTAGNDVMLTKASVAFYYSGTSVPHTIDLIGLGWALNFHPLHLINSHHSRFSPYSLIGLSYNSQRFYGFYGSSDPGDQNMSVSLEPFIGKVRKINADIGLGLEYQIPGHRKSLNFFIECFKGLKVNSKNTKLLEGTSVLDDKGARFGMRFCFIR